MDTRLKEFVARTAQVWDIPPNQVAQLLSVQRQKSLRLNSLRVKKSTHTGLQKSGINLQPISWAPNCFTISDGYNLASKSNQVIAGEALLQDAASFVPVLALDPQANETILDMCAAPGGKTSHIAAITRNKAQLFANDTSKTRFFKMRQLLQTLGARADCSLYDGRFVGRALQNQKFDKILIDAPCSGEAAINPRAPKTYEQWSIAKIKRLSRLQKQLILAGFDALKVGGTLVYSTCTIAPEENEQVVDYLLKRRHAAVQALTATPADASTGLITWQGKQFSPELIKAVRLMPATQHEAFFTAKIIKLGDDYRSDKVYFYEDD